jgi:hypothetical protein
MEDAISTVISVLVWLIIIVLALRKMKRQKGPSSMPGAQGSPTSMSGSQRDMDSATRAKNESSAMGWNKRESSSMPKGQKKQGKYVTYNKKSFFNDSGAQPHRHETKKYKSMAYASNLPPVYILLNGEPVRVADLEGK